MAHHGGDGTFRNPWPSAETRSLAQLLTGPFPLALGGASTSTDVVAPIKVVTPDWGQSLLEQKQDPAEWLRTTFLGHASSLVEVPLAGPGTRGEEAGMLRVLFDPVLESSRVGPPGPLGLGVIGPGRLLPSPCRVLDLPRVDYVAISHNQFVVSPALLVEPCVLCTETSATATITSISRPSSGCGHDSRTSSFSFRSVSSPAA